MATVQALAFSWKSFENKARCEKELRLATEVTSRADLSVQVKNQTGPVQIRAKAEFLVEVENQGSREATDVNVQAVLPGSLMFVNAGQNTDQSENAFVFSEPLVAPGQTVTFKFTAIGVSKGDHVVRCTLQAAGCRLRAKSDFGKRDLRLRSLRGPD